ncbi:hypothetical protein LOC67_22930 [Stieleria sp. JC731]|uniref:hypothetical protein n=1 Tax=Pirellulaceae TaxID=2691357 RepID=UPI001E5E2B71|nr:hypothetical protein [Stieleria sp. JC731]MCC9603413.1 hypothetical protein [Stieleria sp. JC731]
MQPSEYISATAALAQLLIAYLVFRFMRQQQSESWLREFAKIHSEFWNDPVMQEVRLWIACPEAFKAGPKSALENRKAIHENPEAVSVTPDDYEFIEKLDRFLNLVIRILAVNHEVGDKHAHGLWNDLYLDYWAKGFVAADPLLKWYATSFYPNHIELFENPGINGKRIDKTDTTTKAP